MFLTLSTVFISCEEKELITKSALPQASIKFIDTHFDGVDISMIVKETETFSRNYTVYMANGFEIDFTKSGEWDKVDGENTSIPESILTLLPQGILTYVEGSIPDYSIVEINKERSKYEISLSNDMDLKFNSKGEFLRLDD
jgi:hypothetical protein